MATFGFKYISLNVLSTAFFLLYFLFVLCCLCKSGFPGFHASYWCKTSDCCLLFVLFSMFVHTYFLFICGFLALLFVCLGFVRHFLICTSFFFALVILFKPAFGSCYTFNTAKNIIECHVSVSLWDNVFTLWSEQQKFAFKQRLKWHQRTQYPISLEKCHLNLYFDAIFVISLIFHKRFDVQPMIKHKSEKCTSEGKNTNL